MWFVISVPMDKCQQHNLIHMRLKSHYSCFYRSVNPQLNQKNPQKPPVESKKNLSLLDTIEAVTDRICNCSTRRLPLHIQIRRVILSIAKLSKSCRKITQMDHRRNFKQQWNCFSSWLNQNQRRAELHTRYYQWLSRKQSLGNYSVSLPVQYRKVNNF